LCGICGQAGISDKGLLQAMCNSLIHRGPDGEGQYVDEHAAIGMRRLAIIDLVTGDQPISNEDGSLWIVFNGEIYNYRELGERLKEKGHRFKTQSDTEVILHAYEEYGDGCLKYLNGMFAFAIWDKSQRELFLARDRVGIKPLYYWEGPGYLLFGSEIKAILQDPRFKRQINFTALYNYLSRLFVPGDGTIFLGIKQLSPGHFLKYKHGVLRIERYWQLDFSQKLHWTEEDYCDRTYEMLKASVKRQMVADVPLGAFLSGGVDSSGVVALMAESCDRPVKTFSLGFEESEESLLNELPYAKAVAERFGTDHYEFVVKAGDLIQDLPRIIWHFDEPFAGALPQYFLSRLTRQYVKTALGGLGGDELFGSYGRSVRLEQAMNGSRWVSIYQNLPNLLRKVIVESILDNIPNSGKMEKFRRRAEAVVYHAGMVYANSYCLFNDGLKKELLQEWVSEKVDNTLTLDRLLQGYYDETNAQEFMDKMMWVDMRSQLVNEYLHYTDILSMAWSLEMRVPYLDHELIEFVAMIPSAFRSKPDETKYLLKKTLARILPPEVLYRKKDGFSLPYGSWLHNELRGIVFNALSPERVKARGYFDVDFVSNLVKEYYAEGKAEHTYRLWSL
jgi:asparagine synthase (glutamine-hydrolysing)